jgi:cytochrome c oxidase subunit 2
MTGFVRIGLTPLLLSVCSCAGQQSALDPKGPQAEHLSNLIWSFTLICTAVWCLVMLVLALALLRRRPQRPEPLAVDPQRERRAVVVVSAAVTATAFIVLGLTILSYVSQQKLFAKDPPAVTISVTGYQWWWDLRYEDERPERVFNTANEIHVPVGKPVRLKLNARDVIHSFWVPNLMGKMDLIPGQENELQFVADRPGVYRGQCAEFCGWQHARMGLLVVALRPEEFESWREGQIKPASSPIDGERKKGEAVFAAKACVMCHTVRGTSAGSRVGPDLTHFGSRKTIASGTLSMSRGNIGAWIIDPQGIKPGVNMPNVKIEAHEVDPLISYLAGLQ